MNCARAFESTRLKAVLLSSAYWLFGLAVCAQGQSQAELEAERKAIGARIEATQKLLKASKDDQEKTTQELVILKEELALRQQLLSNLSRESAACASRIENRNASVMAAEARLDALKEEYAGMIRLAHRLQNGDAFWGMILDAENTAQVFRRWLLIQEYGRSRKTQADLIAASTDTLRKELEALNQERAVLLGVETEMRAQRDAARQGANRQQSLLSDLKSQELELKNKLAKEEARRAEVGKAIDRIIAEARRNSNANTGFAVTPEGRIIGAEFKANKGKLPWPVAEGVIVGRFGTQNHPTIPGIKIERRGIDIATSAGAEVLTVFSGRVSNVLSIPGGGMVVMVDHGSHRTVYANLAQVVVQDGQDVITGQAIGSVINQGDGHRAHFEIWDASGSKPLNPESWIAR